MPLERLSPSVIVRLSDYGRDEYYDHEANPHHLEGVIAVNNRYSYWDDHEYMYEVMWDNGETNQYRPVDIEPIGGYKKTRTEKVYGIAKFLRKFEEKKKGDS